MGLIFDDGIEGFRQMVEALRDGRVLIRLEVDGVVARIPGVLKYDEAAEKYYILHFEHEPTRLVQFGLDAIDCVNVGFKLLELKPGSVYVEQEWQEFIDV